MKTEKTFIWTEKAQQAWDNVKKRLTTAPMISFPDFRYPFTVCTDASDVACGAVLLQEVNGDKRLIASCSHTFTDTETRWSTTEREAFGILYAVKKWNYFLASRPFTLFTDHDDFNMKD